jgi:hypothetical protein
MSSIGPSARRRQSKTGPEVPVTPTAEQAVTQTGPDNDKVGADGCGPEHTFTLDYTDARGRKWSGEFRCHVLTIRERAQVGLVRAQLSAGMAPIGLDAATLDLLEMQAHLAVALDSAPDWARDLGGLHDPAVLGVIYAEVAGHEARFHGAGTRDNSPVSGP